jgi:peroxiredoxin
MALTESTMALGLGADAPDFALPDVVAGGIVRRDDFRGNKALLVMFICTHCPYVKHVEKGLAALGKDYEQKPLAIVAISSNDAATYPDDSPAGLKQQAQTQGFVFPYLYDESQAVAHAYQAACTPDFFLFDSKFKLAYRGQFDASRPGNGIPVTGQDLRAAIDQVLTGKPAAVDQHPSIGCNIKWKS